MDPWMQRLSGVMPVLPTAFDPDGGVDRDAMRAFVGFAVAAGVDGLVFPGFASEVETLTAEERTELLQVVVDAAAGRVQIVAGASAATVEEAARYGRQALDLGIAHLLLQPPKEIGSAATAVGDFLAAASAALPGARIILQNAPAPRGSDLTPRAIIEVVRRVQAVRYVKEETLPAGPAITAMLAERPEHLIGVIGGGGARYILDEYERGACGAMPALEIADLHVVLDRHYRAGEMAAAREIYVRTLPLLVLQAVYRMRLTKHVLARRGLPCTSVVRAPTPELDAMATADIDRCLDEIEDLRTCADARRRA